MYAILQNFRLALRQLRKGPGFAVTVVLTLALGIGATTAIFSLVEGILLRPLPFKDADQLVLLGDHLATGYNTPGVTAREIETYVGATHAFSSMGAYTSGGYEVSGSATPERVSAARLNASVFSTLGVHPVLGRVFTGQEEDAHQPLVVLSYALWLNRYHRDRNILGGSIVLDRRLYTIIGVMPRGFEFPLQPGHLDQVQLWVPLSLTPDELADQSLGFWGYHLVGRLKDGVTIPQAVQDTDRVAQQIMRNFPASLSAIHITGDVKLVRELLIADVRPLLRTLFLAVAVVLLIACANVAGLLLVRAIRRRREYAVRLALGARSSTILGESVSEGLLLSISGGLLGLVFAAGVIRTALHLLPESMPRVDSVTIDAGVIVFALVTALATGVLCSLAPAFAALQTNLTESLKEGVRSGTGTSSHSWLRSALVVSEIAIALVLLTVAGAFLRSFQKMRAVDPGFRPDHVLVGSFTLPLNHYPTEASVDVFRHSVIDQFSGKPGVIAAGIADSLPASGVSRGSAYTVEGVPISRWKLQFASLATVYGDYFRTMRIPLLEGRYFTLNDNADAPPVVIMNQSMAKHCWPGQEAIGKRIHVGNPKRTYPWATVVGIVADTKIGSLDEPSADQWYAPMQQPAILNGPEATGTLTDPSTGYITLRSALPPEQMRQTLLSAVSGIDPLLALQQVQPMDDVISNVEAPRRFNTTLITAFATGALLLSITGIYAVVAFSVSLRTQEIAIRMVLGAQRTRIARLVLISGAKMALIGCGIGLVCSLAISRMISSFLFGVSATDPLVYFAAVVIMMLMALVASALPAKRAASAEPIDALRSI
ncbi:ABC transporter permease [Alloacidobacterium dinghuense]|uniref:ABC transporter permease n=1 Tax=Alloacidobacterium dinghuense TaxID=2763107 RepID=A0A7G8BCU7_9BACT|nr:ABC transporter permease [Alloacidobacterium dinghuense]QNI30367.1 ABC transporter permease [Alloacidobacterium dinghuense]